MEDDGTCQERGFFGEAEEVLGLIDRLSTPDADAASERIAHILDKYQEQPAVRDPSLEAMVVPVLMCVRGVARGEGDRATLVPACRVMYSLCKVRKYKRGPHHPSVITPQYSPLSTHPSSRCAATR